MRHIILMIFVLFYSINISHAATPPQSAIASAHPLATQAGMEILTAGGNAFDAAVAVTAALAVVEPYSSGLGGGGFWLIHRAADGYQTMLDGRETAPGASHRDMYLDKQKNIIPGASMNGPLSAGIPGTPAAMVHLAEKYGKLSLEKSLAPAIKLARDGFKVDAHYQRLAKFRKKELNKWPASKKLFLQDGEVPPIGHVIKQDDLAQTLELITAKGKAGFYQGRVARQMVAAVVKNGGIWTLADLANYQLIERKPITGTYRGMRITSAAPPSSGGIAILNMLNILEAYDLERMPSVEQKQIIVEAMRRAYRDRAIYLGDPDFVDVPVKQLTDKMYAAGQRASIRMDKATPSDLLPGIEAGGEGFHTTHFSILDQAGNRVAATVTVNFPFGSCFVAAGTGVLLNDEMDDFSAKPGTPNVYGLVGADANAIAPGKRPLSSMSPSFIESDDAVAILGTPGGSRIITMVLLGMLDFARGNLPQSWVDYGRFHHQYLPDQIQYEAGALTKNEITELQKRGHELKQTSWRYGNMQAILWDIKQQKVFAASDERGVGGSLVEHVP